jgi:type I restriction enzyme, S subunit
MLSRFGRHQITAEARGSSQSMVKIAQSHVRSLTIVAPRKQEQQTIVRFLDESTGKIDRLALIVGDGIEKLREYRTALISAAVTGKIDVRGEAE